MLSINIRSAELADVSNIIEIYSHYVLHSTVTFEIQVPGHEEMSARLRKAYDTRCPFLVCEVDNQTAGFAYASLYRLREGYRYTVEGSIYIASDFQGMGLGVTLLNALFDRCRTAGFKQMIAVVTGETGSPSYRFHKNNGFAYCGSLKNVGNKFDSFIDTHFFQKAI